MQDNGGGYNKELNQLSAEDNMQIEGWSRTCYSKTTLILQVHECTNIWKYLEIWIWKAWMKAQRSKTWNMKIVKRKWEKCERSKRINEGRKGTNIFGEWRQGMAVLGDWSEVNAKLQKVQTRRLDWWGKMNAGVVCLCALLYNRNIWRCIPMHLECWGNEMRKYPKVPEDPISSLCGVCR